MTVIWAIIDWFARLDPRIWQALIAGFFVGLGWFVNGQLSRRSAKRLRQERLRDVQKALFAEISAYIEVLDGDQLESYGANIVRRIETGGDGTNKFVPFIPTERNDIVFRAIVADIHVLPRATIDPIVLYYSQLDAIAALIDDLRSTGYAALPAARRIAIYRDYISLKKEALDLGHAALEAIEMYDTFGQTGVTAWEAYKKRAERERILPEVIAWVEARKDRVSLINTLGADPSDQ